jgi:flagellar biosynthesis/type III secretory pathway protein FliH
MSNGFSSSSRHGGGVLLFDEDFDLPPHSAPPDPEVIEPLFTLAELRAAQEEAARESREATLTEVHDSAMMKTSRALASIAEQLTAARDEDEATAEQSSNAIVRLLFDCFATAFPALSERLGAGEAAALLRHILPAMHREPKITVRVSPHIVEAMEREIGSLDPDLAAHVRLVATDAVVSGDAQVTWEHGSATRDAASLWNQIENILAPAGLLDTEKTAKEHALVE